MHISLVDILLQNPLTYRRKDGNIHHAGRHRKQRITEETTMKEIKIFEQAMHEDNEFFRTHQLNLTLFTAYIRIKKKKTNWKDVYYIWKIIGEILKMIMQNAKRHLNG